MITVNFKQLAVTNFLSIGNSPVVIDFTPGTHIITGINLDKPERRNGVGKSTIIEAFYYAIIGNSLRNIKQSYISNNITGKGGKISLTFDIIENEEKHEYKIERSIKPSKCIFIVDGVDKTRDSIANTTKDICNILHITPEILQNCVIMSLNDNVPFMSRTKNEKREFIEHIFRLEIFNDMFNDIKTEYNNYKKDSDTQKSLQSQYTTQYESYKVKQQQAEEKFKTDIIRLNDIKKAELLKISQIENKIEQMVIPDISNIPEQRQEIQGKIEKCQGRIDESNTMIGELNAVIVQLKKQLKVLEDTKANCPTCGKPFEDVNPQQIQLLKETKLTDINTEILKLREVQKELQKFKEVLDILYIKCKKLDIQEREAEQCKYEYKSFKESIVRIQEKISLINEQITTLKQTTVKSYDDIINDLKAKLDDIDITLKQLEKQLYIAGMCKFITSEEGVKSFLIKKIIGVFNSKLDYYIKKLDGNSICKFNEFFDETMSNNEGKQCSYNNFSGAERKAIDLACLFTFMDMRCAQGNVTYNVSFYDELFDSSLDEKGIRKVADILTERVQNNNECVYVITHRDEISDFATGETIMLEKKDGITRRV